MTKPYDLPEWDIAVSSPPRLDDEWSFLVRCNGEIVDRVTAYSTKDGWIRFLKADEKDCCYVDPETGGLARGEKFGKIEVFITDERGKGL